MTTKAAIRTKMRLLRAQLQSQQIAQVGQVALRKLWYIVQQRHIHVLHTYLPINKETDTIPFIEQCLAYNIHIIVPQTLNNQMLKAIELTALSDLATGKFGTKHPKLLKESNKIPELIIVPGLAFDKQGNRLGYGQGYYDRLLKQHPTAYTVGLGYNFQLLPTIPTQTHDVALDKIVTV